MISYRVELDSPGSHYLKVRLNLSTQLTQGQLLWLPDWIPGSYMIRDFARNIVSLEATCLGEPVELIKQDKSSWSLSRDVSELEVSYTVYAWDLSVRSAHFDDQHCFFNGTSMFLVIEGYQHLEHRVLISPPEFESAKNWIVATAMQPLKVDQRGFGEYTSQDYAELIDHPFEIAELETIAFEVFGVEHRMVFSEAPKHVDYQRIADDVKKICHYQCQLFADSNPPFDHYVFMTFVLKQGFGGLEHRASTALHCSHADLPSIFADKEQKSTDYQRFLALCSHEYFHSWNVKRIKPKQFEKYRLRNEVYTELLWFFEGVTSYYDELALVRAGVITLEQYLDMLAKNMTKLLRGSGRTKQSVTESSFYAWSKYYKQDENSVNSIVSYYIKGGLISMLLDFEIRRCTNNSNNLDDLMRLIWNQLGKPEIGVEEKQIQHLAEQLCGQSLDKFFKSTLYSTEELPFEDLFNELGIEIRIESEIKQLEAGGFVDKLPDRSKQSSLGVIAKVHDLGAELVNVYENSSAAKVGLSNKDIIIAIEGYRVTFEQLDKTIAKYPPGSEVLVSFFRRDKLHQRRCKLEPLVANVCYLSCNKENLSPKLKEWLSL